MVVRATCVCVHEGRLLLVRQAFDNMGVFWSLPGGKVESAETLEAAVVRETKEETGITVRPIRLLYVSQRIFPEKHIIQILFETEYLAGTLGDNLALTSTETVYGHKFVPVDELEAHGISAKFAEKVRGGFTDAGVYVDSMSDIGL